MLFVYNYYSKDEMIKVTDAIHELMGEGQHGKLISAKEHVDKVFETMDTNQDGKVTIEEFNTKELYFYGFNQSGPRYRTATSRAN